MTTYVCSNILHKYLVTNKYNHNHFKGIALFVQQHLSDRPLRTTTLICSFSNILKTK